MKQDKPIVSAAELDALIQGWGSMSNQSVDRFFPLRFWFVTLITVFYCVYLLFWTDAVAQRMTSDPAEVVRMGRFLYFRGWFLLVVIVLGLYAYLRNWYTAIVFSALFLLGCVNLVFDMFNVYAEVIARPTPRVTIMLMLRLTALWFIYLSVKNVSRMPDVKDRMNVLLIFKRRG